MPVAFPQLFKTQFDWDFATEPEQGLGWRTLFTAPRQFKASYKATSSPMHAHDHAAVRVRADNSALLAHDFSAAVAKCVVVTNRSLEVTMLKSDPQLMRYPPACRSVKFATRTQHWAFRLRYAAGVAMAFVLSSLAPAMLIALIWHETGLAAMMFAFTFLIALSHAIL
ncbi:MAG TPA: hypothetical protein VGK96_04295, partial [Candidatus Sulfotelmatobacter sp.]